MLKKLNDKYGLDFNGLLGLGSIIAFIYVIFFKLTFYNILNVEWYVAILSPQQIILSSLTLLAISAVSIIFSFFFDKVFKITLISEIKDLVYLFFYAFIIYIIIWMVSVFGIYSNDIPLKYKNYITYIGLNIGFSSLYFFHKKIVLWGENQYGLNNNYFLCFKKVVAQGVKFLAPLMCVTGIAITPIVLGYDAAIQVKSQMAKILPEVILKEEERKWYLLEANSTDSLLITQEDQDGKKSYKTRTVEMKEIEVVK
ncbi:hypothetical protein Q5M45_03995 [Acinetobacter pittii]|uniref:hypothetical protein n=1 Tax=Acinetobacter pittii TaxID=48296 RepID=UPI0008285378|nr:hypothetical protein [Acinetobacter pittii]MBJ9719770.1 hypothetical protein [Acinetobacter pittii]MBJ9778136.1 hypothetical protein [Acinetobacter pittii]MDO7196578.1 hypothetical protein [Acinetobacter pittii]MDX8205120.1 hypothetical protein [Acinetobacter pittii]MDX8230915.1 hypothetical protein [Acinetobacter pittii]